MRAFIVLLTSAALLMPTVGARAADPAPYGMISRPESIRCDIPDDPPKTLQATHCFKLPSRAPEPGVIPYTVNAPLWTDGATKRRFIVLPFPESTIGFTETGAWRFPPGTVLIKEFIQPGTSRIMETRFLVSRGGERWQGYSYEWNKAQTDAKLLPPPAVVRSFAPDHAHFFPSRRDCKECHNSAAGFILGIQTSQMNRDFDYSNGKDNQLRAFEHAGLFGGTFPASKLLAELPSLSDPYDPKAPDEKRVRSYLQVNCAHCHRPGQVQRPIDFRFETPLAQTGLCGKLSPGHPESSEVLFRISQRPGMPPLGSLKQDPAAIQLFKHWIGGLKQCSPSPTNQSP